MGEFQDMLWSARSTLLETMDEVQGNSQGDVDFYRKLEWKEILRSKNELIVISIKPPKDFLKLNVDGCSDPMIGKSATGGILRNHQGSLIECFSVAINYGSPIQAEAQASLIGMEMCLRREICT